MLMYFVCITNNISFLLPSSILPHLVLRVYPFQATTFLFHKSFPPCKHPVKTPHHANKLRRKPCKHPVKRPLVNTLKHLVKRTRVCVCIDYEAMLNALIEAMAQITQHINILYILVQSLMDDTS